MSRYLIGTDALGAAQPYEGLLAKTSLNATESRRLVDLCLKALKGRTDTKSQELTRIFQNMGASIDASNVDVLPPAAAKALQSTAQQIVGHHGGGGGHHHGGGGGWGRGPRWEPFPLWDEEFIDYVDVDDFDENQDAADILGAYDIASAQKKMNGLKLVPVSAAQAILKGGLAAIEQAISIADAHNLPGPTERKNVHDHLLWHADALAKLTATPNAMYSSAEDLKKYTMMAMVDENATEEGAAYLEQIWNLMWQEIEAAYAALPAKAAQAVKAAANYAVETATGLPIWAWTVIAIGGVGLLGYGAYRVLRGPAGYAVARHYLP